MSDSSSSFSELKDGESTAPSTSIPIQTSLTHPDKPLPTTVTKPSAVSGVNSDYSSLFIPAPHPAYSVDWFTHYLKQTRVLLILALLVYLLVLVIWIAALGKASTVAASGNGGVACPQWSGAELVPNIVSSCPPARAEIYYAGAPSSGGVRINGNSVTQADVSSMPLAIFVPNAAQSYYYTAIFLDPDFPTRASPTGQSQLRGVVTNLRLGESVDTGSGTWVQMYEGPTSTDTQSHRYIWLVYRHASASNNLQVPVQQSGFKVEDWLTSSWSQRPTLVAAAWFEAAGSR